jgi:hypothetical protein
MVDGIHRERDAIMTWMKNNLVEGDGDGLTFLVRGHHVGERLGSLVAAGRFLLG